MPDSLLIWPMFAHLCWVVLLFVALTLARAPEVWAMDIPSAWAAYASKLEPRISANLNNQFEWPIFFHVGCVLMILGEHEISRGVLAAAWAFSGGRVLHTAVQIFTKNIRLRGLVFTINFLAVIALWVTLIA